jgi:phosphate starvation-inducible membrane PsiE
LEVVSEADATIAYRSWVLILGMSGLIVFFWFIGGGVALRYFVSIGFTNLSLHVLTLFFFSKGTFCWSYVMFVLRMGCDRFVGMGRIDISSRSYFLNPWF